VLSATLRGEPPQALGHVGCTKPKAVADLHTELVAMRILITDRDGSSIAWVVAGHRSQSGVEADFGQVKVPRVWSFSPMFHGPTPSTAGASPAP